MANPQKENGFTPICNELLDVILKTNFIATHLKLILCCCRYTYGFSRKEAELSESYIVNKTGISKRYVSQELNVLISMNVILVIKESTFTSSRTLALNKNYDEWGSRTTVPQVNRNATVEPEQDTTVEPQFHTTVEPQFHTTVEPQFHHIKKDIKKELKQGALKKDIDDLFESIWLFYPVKKGKKDVSNKQKKILYDIGYTELKRCYERYNKDKEEWKAYQQGSTFFNSGYFDYLDENFHEQIMLVPEIPARQKSNYKREG